MEDKFLKYFKNDSLELDWDYIMTIPEFKAMESCEQSPTWHKEGTALQHTLKCLEHAYERIDEISDLSDDDKKVYIMAVLMHDVGKPACATFKKGGWHHYGHEIESERISRELLDGCEDRETIALCAKYHMKMHRLFEQKDFIEELIRMSREVDLNVLSFVHECDCYGSVCENPKCKEDDFKRMTAVTGIIKNLMLVDEMSPMFLIPNEFLYRNK